MPKTTTLKVPSSQLACRIATVTEEGSRLRVPFLAFASAARQALADFDAEVDVAGLTEEELQDAADALVRLHSDIEAMSDGFCDLIVSLGGHVAIEETAVAA